MHRVHGGGIASIFRYRQSCLCLQQQPINIATFGFVVAHLTELVFQVLKQPWCAYYHQLVINVAYKLRDNRERQCNCHDCSSATIQILANTFQNSNMHA
jgi:hypothetical protein